jgi:hypothetical protein
MCSLIRYKPIRDQRLREGLKTGEFEGRSGRCSIASPTAVCETLGRNLLFDNASPRWRLSFM